MGKATRNGTGYFPLALVLAGVAAGLVTNGGVGAVVGLAGAGLVSMIVLGAAGAAGGGRR